MPTLQEGGGKRARGDATVPAPCFAQPRDAEQHPGVAQGWMNVAKTLWESAAAFLRARCPCTEQFCSSWRGGSDFTALEGTLEASLLQVGAAAARAALQRARRVRGVSPGIALPHQLLASLKEIKIRKPRKTCCGVQPARVLRAAPLRLASAAATAASPGTVPALGKAKVAGG